MGKTATRWTDQRVEIFVGNLLRTGVLISAGMVAIGAAIFLLRHGRAIPPYTIFVGEPEELRTIWGVLRGAASFRGRHIIQLGLLLLIATPVTRVGFSIITFLLQRDRLYVGITIVVLAVLVFGLAGGHF
jgi:uncharacterized membrane protein